MLSISAYTEILQNPHLDAWQRGYFERRYKQLFLDRATATSVWCPPVPLGAAMLIGIWDYPALPRYLRRIAENRAHREHERGQGN